jgi:hypothetical protein
MKKKSVWPRSNEFASEKGQNSMEQSKILVGEVTVTSAFDIKYKAPNPRCSLD